MRPPSKPPPNVPFLFQYFEDMVLHCGRLFAHKFDRQWSQSAVLRHTFSTVDRPAHAFRPTHSSVIDTDTRGRPFVSLPTDFRLKSLCFDQSLVHFSFTLLRSVVSCDCMRQFTPDGCFWEPKKKAHKDGLRSFNFPKGFLEGVTPPPPPHSETNSFVCLNGSNQRNISTGYKC